MTKALIIGGGIGGLAAGIALQKAGLTVEIFEQVAVLQEVGAGLSLWHNALKALALLDVYEAIRPVSMLEMLGGIRTKTGDVLIGSSLDEVKPPTGELLVTIYRATLHQILRDAVEGDALFLDRVCLYFEADEKGVTAFFEDGSQASGDILIGADGIHSVVRQQIHQDGPPVYSGYTAWRSIVDFPILQLALGETWGTGARFGQIPVSDKQAYWFATFNAPAGERNPGEEKKTLLDIFGDWHAPIPALIEQSDETTILRNDIYDRNPLKWWGTGRVTLLGDAAHPMSPNMGQGACQALEDAVVLGKCLLREPDLVAALRLYEAYRISRTTTFVNQSRLIGQVGQWVNPSAISLRNFLMKHVVGRFQKEQLPKLVDYNFEEL